MHVSRVLLHVSDVVPHVHLHVNIAQEEDHLRFEISAMPWAHDASSLNEIASKSAIASRALVCEKLGRNDVDISCVRPPLFCRFILQFLCFVFV